jgi:hypothetical protein
MNTHGIPRLFRLPARAAAAGLAAAACLLGGCSSPAGPTKLEIQPAQYPQAFEAAKEALRHYRFPLERVDYVQGEISSDQKFSSGLATPWDAEQSTIENEWEDYINSQSRSVRIRFETASQIALGGPEEPGTQAAATPAPASLEEASEPLFAQVIVTIYRVNRPGWRPQTKAVRRSSFTEDPELTARGMYPGFQTIISRDEKLASRIVERMKQTMAAAKPPEKPGAEPQAPAQPETPAPAAPPAPVGTQAQAQPPIQ